MVNYSIYDLIDDYVPSYRSVYERDLWLYKMGKTITREDVLGVKDGYMWYSVYPLSRVWDWIDTPYDPPLSANDWYIVIKGMPRSDFKDEFLVYLAYSLIGHIDDDSIHMALKEMKNNYLTLTFNTSTDTYEIV